MPTTGTSTPDALQVVTRKLPLPCLTPFFHEVLFLGLVLPASEPDRASHVK